MNSLRLYSRVASLVCLISVTSCGLISQTGPLKSSIEEGASSYRLVEVKTQADLPGAKRAYGNGSIPGENRGQAYSDKVRSRDTLNFVVTDLTPESPFHTAGDSYKFGPVEVPEDGRIDFPYVGTIQVIGRRLSEVSSDLGEKIKPVSSTARVSVIRSGRIAKTANVIGEVRKPGSVPIERADFNSLDLLAAAGGPNEKEHLFQYNLRRNGSDHLMDYLTFRQKPFMIEEGDLLNVTSDTTSRFHVMGAINRPRTVPFPVPSPTLADALGASTGLDEQRSDASGVFVFRKGDPDVVYTLNLKDPSSMHLLQRFPIQGNDVIYVTEAPLARWNRLITQLLPVSVAQAANSASRFGTN